MLKKALLLSAPVLALIVPEVFHGWFNALRASPRLLVYQVACALWFAGVVWAMVPWRKLAARHSRQSEPPLALMGSEPHPQHSTITMLSERGIEIDPDILLSPPREKG